MYVNANQLQKTDMGDEDIDDGGVVVVDLQPPQLQAPTTVSAPAPAPTKTVTAGPSHPQPLPQPHHHCCQSIS